MTIVISPASSATLVGQTQQFSAAATDANGNPITGVTFTWSSDLPSIAIVDSSGNATGVGLGTAHIIATASGFTGSGSLAVSNNPGSNVITSSFFGMTSVDAQDYPAVPIGSLGHPPTLAWGWIEQSKGVYSWTTYDRYVNDAQAHAADFVLTFGDTPPWAAADQSNCQTVAQVTVCPSPPTNIQDWKDFVQAVITHYNGVTAPHIKYYELWNEANSTTHWTGTISDMLNLAQAAYPIIHQDPNAILLTPSVTAVTAGQSPNTMVNWMTSYLQAGGNLYADGGTFHGYLATTGTIPYPMPEQDTTSGCIVKPVDCYGSILTKVTNMRAVFDNNGLKNKPMFDTEGSWGDLNITDPTTQSAWVSRWFILQASLNVQRVYWFSWGAGAAQLWGDLETAALTPSTAGIAYTQVYDWIAGATFTTPCSADIHSTWTCALTRSNGYQAQIAWNTSGSVAYTAPSQFTQYRDLKGNTTPISGNVTIGSLPILLEN
jgi:hypothetical protein